MVEIMGRHRYRADTRRQKEAGLASVIRPRRDRADPGEVMPVLRLLRINARIGRRSRTVWRLQGQATEAGATPSLQLRKVKKDGYYAARSRIMPPQP